MKGDTWSGQQNPIARGINRTRDHDRRLGRRATEMEGGEAVCARGNDGLDRVGYPLSLMCGSSAVDGGRHQARGVSVTRTGPSRGPRGGKL